MGRHDPLVDVAPRPGPAAAVAIGAIRAYRLVLSPAKRAIFGPGAGCRFYPTCSAYGLEAYRLHGFLKGSSLTAARILRCGPWHPGGIDPVPGSDLAREASDKGCVPPGP